MKGKRQSLKVSAAKGSWSRVSGGSELPYQWCSPKGRSGKKGREGSARVLLANKPRSMNRDKD